MPKPNATETTAPALVSIRAVYTIMDGKKTHVPGSILEVPAEDAQKLIAAGAAMLPTDDSHVAIEDLVPIGMDPAIWMADPRAKVNGQMSASFVKRSEFEAHYQANC
jgi:hypothetical protein